MLVNGLGPRSLWVLSQIDPKTGQPVIEDEVEGTRKVISMFGG